MKRKNNRKGFTLAELLIVVGIISTLTGVGIPVFNSQLEKAREATDLANVRAAYAKVMTAAMMMHETEEHNAEDVIYMHDRWYIDVELKQKKAGWQTNGPFTVGGVDSTNGLHWVGSPVPSGICLVSYSKDHGMVIAWEHNFAQIMNQLTIPAYDDVPAQYVGKTVAQLINDSNFPMLESSGATGAYIASEIKHQLGMKDSKDFSYKLLKANGYPKNYYEIYISDSYTLKQKVDSGKVRKDPIKVTGYIYYISPDGASTLIKQGTEQEVAIYANSSKQEKMDVYGTFGDGNPAYSWDS